LDKVTGLSWRNLGCRQYDIDSMCPHLVIEMHNVHTHCRTHIAYIYILYVCMFFVFQLLYI
jgi:hypothetical protein